MYCNNDRKEVNPMNKGVIIGAVVAVAVLAAGGLVISSLFQPVERELVSSAPA